jgi:amino acid efflux transporter
VLLILLLVGVSSTSDLIRATSACFVAVYVAATASAVRILRGVERGAALIALAIMLVVAAFSGWYLLLPAVSAICFMLIRRGSDDVRAARTSYGRLPTRSSAPRR